ncbi:MAG TPA: hypothetical protein QF861_14915, partial [Alphaproteobacteria bacterium]|nr:hypothetical protein [Alphaproteobacteria bacterium]
AKWASNNGQIIKSGLPNDRRAKFLPSVVGFAYDLLRYECYLGNIGLSFSLANSISATTGAASPMSALGHLQTNGAASQHVRNWGTTGHSYLYSR